MKATMFLRRVGVIAAALTAILAMSAPALRCAAAEEPLRVVGNIAAGNLQLELIQEVRNGTNGLTRMEGLQEIGLCGDYLYCAANNGTIIGFRRDAASGKLTPAGEWNVSPVELKEIKSDKRTLKETLSNRMAFANGRMYSVQGFWIPYRPCASKGLVWFDLDAKTGQPVEKGRIDCPADKALVASPDGKSLYVRSTTESKLVWFSLDQDGRPTKAGELAGPGLQGHPGDVDVSRLAISPDGRNLYAVNDNYPDKKDERDHVIAWVERKTDGSLVYKGSVDLKPHRAAGIKHSSLFLSPDGRHLYVGLAGYGAGQSARLLFKRALDTGELTLQEKTVPPKPFPYHRLNRMCFDPSGRTAYGECIGDNISLLVLSIDPESGAFEGKVPRPLDRRTLPGVIPVVDSSGKYLYAAQGGGNSLWVFSVTRRE